MKIFIDIMANFFQICSPSGSEALHKETKSTDKTLKVMFLGFYHCIEGLQLILANRVFFQMVEGGLHNLYAEKEPIRSEAIKDTVDWVVARI